MKNKFVVEERKVVAYDILTDCINVFITEWGNGEGIEIFLDTPKKAPGPAVKLRDVRVSLSWEQVKALKAILSSAWANYTGGE